MLLVLRQSLKNVSKSIYSITTNFKSRHLLAARCFSSLIQKNSDDTALSIEEPKDEVKPISDEPDFRGEKNNFIRDEIIKYHHGKNFSCLLFG